MCDKTELTQEETDKLFDSGGQFLELPTGIKLEAAKDDLIMGMEASTLRLMKLMPNVEFILKEIKDRIDALKFMQGLE